MCSIIGYKGRLNVASVLVDSLKRMEYRGYDSVGIATINNGKILIKKDIGKVADVNKSLDLGRMPGHTGIGHTRWATHGDVTYKNAHPHYGCTDRIAIVHNGIIENYKELREELIFLGHTFVSDTDSEVIAHLLERHYSGQKNIKKTVIEACRRLKGTYAFVAAFEDGTICGSRYDEPLIIGSVNNGYFISSDVLGFLEYTDKAIFLDNRDIVIVDSETCHIFDLDGNIVDRAITKVAWELAAIDKGKYAHHTLKEIHEQPNIVQKAGTQNLEKIEEFCNIVMNSKTLFLVGSGTSYHSALIAKHILSKFAKIRAEAIISSEFQFAFDDIDNTSVIIAISQSGETADVLQSVKAAKTMGARILSIVNNPTSSLARISDSSLSIDCGPEIGVAATKSFTAQLSLIYTIVDRLCNGCLDFEANKAFLVGALRQVLDTEIQIHSIAEGLRDARDIYIIGRSIHYAIALEGALKIKELAYVHTEGIAAGELKHGPLALIDRNSYVLLVNPTDMASEDNIASAYEIKARGAKIIGISDRPNNVYDIFIKIPSVKSTFYPIIEVLPFQILAYYLALAKDADPDYPRNLAKSVTVK
ncbi:MAG: glutamine--fructose-6-phosphate transaminase (isomerizing) [Candidatus Nitrosopolaris wilkensis]|nr:MAG: glutamine--fructose-6-phosphate transaminase (isomerizing) [Candidatus Nitrosopolaris wilkensis]